MAKWYFGTPNAKQDAVLRLRSKYVAYGGARGGGKSWLVRQKAVLEALTEAGIKQLIVRSTYSELYNNHIRPLMASTRGLARYNDQKKLLYFPNGSTIQFGYCRNERDMEQYQGGEWDIEYLDEAGNIAEGCIMKFRATVRGVNDFPKRTYYTLNPGGRSHAYFKRVFIDRQFTAEENPADYAFVQALARDNAALMDKDPDYIRQLQALPERLRLAWLEGRWDVFAGQFFEDFEDSPENEDGRWTNVIPPYRDGPGFTWRIIRSYDYGYDKPFDCSWYALTPDNVLHLMLQLYGCTGEPNVGLHWPVEKQFSEIARIEREHPWLRGRRIQGVADPAIWNRESNGLCIADEARKHGLLFDKANNDRINGWAQCHNRLAFDANGYPRFYAWTTARAFRRCIPTLIYDEHRVEDLDTEGEDHCADTWRYVCNAYLLPPREITRAARISPENDPLEMMRETQRMVRRY